MPENDEAWQDEASGIMPKVTFTTFTMSLASSALVHLGEVPDPDKGQTGVNLLMAKHTIDILTMLEDKTRDNLDEAEERLIKALLYELRMKYVLKAK
ncbi:DUF1844 domain-containing protein [Desulfovibrio sp. OttesenSCG-928-I05]|nr:DUF1844 domain-containing protein [Desulfovibrio sp. OttesenSCG-928-I05]